MVSTAIILGSFGLRFKYEELIRDKVDLNKKIKEERTLKVKLVAQYQAVSSEDRIVPIAENKLGMIKRTQPKIIISVNKNLINEVNENLKAKYE
jgi:hypothetical protein